MRPTASLLLVLLLPLGAGAEDGGEALPELEYADGRVSADLRRAPLDRVLAALERETGAVVQGDILDWREVTKRLDEVPLHEALDRLLGKQNFVVVYDAAGRPSRIELLGVAQPRATPDPRVAARDLSQLIRAHPPVALPARLAAALRAPRARLPRLLSAAARQPEAEVRAVARGLVLATIRNDAALRTAFGRLDASGLVQFVQRWVGAARSREFLAGVAAEARDPLLRLRAARAVQALAPVPTAPTISPAGRPHAARPPARAA